MLSSNFELFLRTLTLLFAFAFFTAAGEKLGTDVVAANAVMMQFMLFSAFALDGFAYAAEGLAGEALGRNDLPGFHAVTRRCALWSAGAAVAVSVVILLGRPLLFPLLTSLPEVLSIMGPSGSGKARWALRRLSRSPYAYRWPCCPRHRYRPGRKS